jgi:DNA polymerase-3 subunit epsilon
MLVPRVKRKSKNDQGSFPILAFLDIETTGSNFERDRITEIGIKTLSNNEVSDWKSLINSETLLLFVAVPGIFI